MRWNPFLNAAGAAAYIGAIGLLFWYISSIHRDTPDTFLDPIIALSLLVFSAAVMGFLFFYRPLLLLLENKRSEAMSFFMKTLVTFGIITALLLVMLRVL